MGDEIESGKIVLTGDTELVRTLSVWMKLSSFAPI
jgi:hypothetical protein